MARVMLGELLVGAGLVTEAQVLAAVRGQRATGLPLGLYFIRTGVLTEDLLMRVLSQQLTVPIVALDTVSIGDDAVAKVPKETALSNLIVPYRLDGKLLMIATADPTREDLLVQLRMSTMCDARFSLTTPSAIERGLERAYGAAVAAQPFLPRPARAATDPGASSVLEQRLARLEQHVSMLVNTLADSDLVDVSKFKT